MNKMKTLWAVALAALTLMPACSNDDDWDYDPETGMPVSPTEIPEAIRSAFYAQYGEGARVQWSKKDGYAVADFEGAGPGGEQTVWYGMTDGAWAMTETEILLSALPESVAAAFAATEYAAAPWRASREVDVLSRSTGETLYVIEVEKNENGRETEADLFFTEAGVLAKVVLDADREAGYSGYLPQQPAGNVEAGLDEHFPGAGIVDVERENGGTEVEIVWDGLAHDVIFDAAGNWQLGAHEDRVWPARPRPCAAGCHQCGRGGCSRSRSGRGGALWRAWSPLWPLPGRSLVGKRRKYRASGGAGHPGLQSDSEICNRTFQIRHSHADEFRVPPRASGPGRLPSAGEPGGGSYL